MSISDNLIPERQWFSKGHTIIDLKQVTMIKQVNIKTNKKTRVQEKAGKRFKAGWNRVG